MREILIAFILVFCLHITIDKPASQKAEAEARPPQSASKAIKEKVVKDASPKKKTVKQAPAKPSVASKPAISNGSAKSFIYSHESGNNPAAKNGSGCRGLGQACPGSKLPCADTDYACQDAWFTNYMKERYGTWEAAKAHWLARVPINGVDVGNWW